MHFSSFVRILFRLDGTTRFQMPAKDAIHAKASRKIFQQPVANFADDRVFPEVRIDPQNLFGKCGRGITDIDNGQGVSDWIPEG